MNISVLTLFPSLYESFLRTSLIGKAIEHQVIRVSVENLLSFPAPKERVDSPTFGHGSGMLLRPELVEKGIETVETRHGKAFKIFFSPHGKKMDQLLIRSLADRIMESTRHVLLVPARYEGMDARVEEEFADEIVSVGDFVLMGGDIPAMMMIEALARYVPGVVGKESSVEAESFSGAVVDYPAYTAPVSWRGRTVPEVLRSGNHAAMAAWRADQAAARTAQQHFDWFRGAHPSSAEVDSVKKHIPVHYAALMHDQIMLPGDQVGTSSVTSLDIHDIARSAKTYGIKKYFIVTPLEDQQRIVRTLLDFWTKGEGVTYNRERHEAVSLVTLVGSLDEVVQHIELETGVQPLKIATSAKSPEGGWGTPITYHDQARVWRERKPILLLFGTGRGLASDVVHACDYVFVPITGMTAYNHLSVRSAAAIVFDRWLGLQPRFVG